MLLFIIDFLNITDKTLISVCVLVLIYVAIISFVIGSYMSLVNVNIRYNQ